MTRNWISEFATYLHVEKGLSPNSVSAYRRDVAKLEKFGLQHGVALVEFTRADILRWMQHLRKSGLSPWT